MADIPSREELRRLIRAAVAYRDAAPWVAADPEDLLVIENPETGQIGFLQTLPGGATEHPGARISLDAETIDLTDRMQDSPPGETANLGMRCNLVTVLLAPTEECVPDELGIYADAGVDVPGDRVPMFYRFVPRRLPRDIDAGAARFATIALEQARLGFMRFDEGTNTIAVRVLRDGVWRDEVRAAEDVFRVDRPAPPELRPEWSGLAQRFRKREPVWELGAMLLPRPIDLQDDELICAHMVADEGGPFLETASRHRDPEGLCELLVEAIELRHARPKLLLFSDPAIEHAMKNLTGSAGIETEVIPQLPVIGVRYEILMRDILTALGVATQAEPPLTGIQTIAMPEGFRHRALVVDFDDVRSRSFSDLTQDDARRIESASRLSMAQPRKGVKQLRALVEEFPERMALRSALARTCLAAGWPGKALEVTTDTMRAMPASLELKILHAQVLLEVKGPAMALVALGGDELYDIVDEATTIGFDDAVAFHLLSSIIAFNLDDGVGGYRHLAAVEQLRPNDPQIAAAVTSVRALLEDGDDDGIAVELPEPEQIIRMRIALDDVEPAIWRTFEVASNWTFATLHDVIQDVMGWTDSHLHEFFVGKTKIVMDLEGEPIDGEIEDAVRLDTYIKRRTKLTYVYDFGDSWSHTIVVEAITAPEPGVSYPRLLAGARACPPEDCGGPWGYVRLLEVLRDRANEEHEEMLQWLGGNIDPAAFNLDERNEELAWMRG